MTDYVTDSRVTQEPHTITNMNLQPYKASSLGVPQRTATLFTKRTGRPQYATSLNAYKSTLSSVLGVAHRKIWQIKNRPDQFTVS